MRRNSFFSRSTVARATTALACAWVLGGAVNAAAQAAGPLFPRPFVVEHRLVETDADGSVFESPAVTDTYAGSWIISARPDGGRTLIDFARREITAIEPEKGSYSVLSFDRMAELKRRLQAAESSVAPPERESVKANTKAESPVRFAARELPIAETRGTAGAGATGLLGRAGVRHLRVSATREGSERAAGAASSPVVELDVWLDPTMALGAQAQAALATLERDVLGNGARDGVAACLAHAREQAGGAFPIRTERAASPRALSSRVVDEAIRLEALGTVPVELVKVPDGFRRVPHPLETVVAYAEQEAELNRAMSGVRK
jgi:hypothetical protein